MAVRRKTPLTRNVLDAALNDRSLNGAGRHRALSPTTKWIHFQSAFVRRIASPGSRRDETESEGQRVKTASRGAGWPSFTAVIGRAAVAL